MGLISLIGKSKPNHSFKQTITDIIGYSPKNLMLFERVFTHRSLEKVGDDGRKINYERLEFLVTNSLENACVLYSYGIGNRIT